MQFQSFVSKLVQPSLILLPIIRQNNEPLKTTFLLHFPKPITRPSLCYVQLIHNPWHWLTVMSRISYWWWFQKSRSQNPQHIGNNKKNHLSCWNKRVLSSVHICHLNKLYQKNETLVQVLNPNILCGATCKPLLC
jgi:hypothetical protein